MIARLWRGRAARDQADAYHRHVTLTVFPEIARIPGQRGGYVLRREVDGEAGGAVEFLVVTLWDSMDAVREFAGAAPGIAVVEPAARALLSGYDEVVQHYDVVHAPAMTGGPQ